MQQQQQQLHQTTVNISQSDKWTSTGSETCKLVPPAIERYDMWLIPETFYSSLPETLDFTYGAFILISVFYRYYDFDASQRRWVLSQKFLLTLESKDIPVNKKVKTLSTDLLEYVYRNSMITHTKEFDQIHKEITSMGGLPYNITSLLQGSGKYINYKYGKTEVMSIDVPEEVATLVYRINEDMDMAYLRQIDPKTLLGSVRSHDVNAFLNFVGTQNSAYLFFGKEVSKKIVNNFSRTQVHGVWLWSAHNYFGWLKRRNTDFFYPDGFLPMPRMWDSKWYPAVLKYTPETMRIIETTFLIYLYIFEKRNNRFLRVFPIDEPKEMNNTPQQNIVGSNMNKDLLEYLDMVEEFKNPTKSGDDEEGEVDLIGETERVIEEIADDDINGGSSCTIS